MFIRQKFLGFSSLASTPELSLGQGRLPMWRRLVFQTWCLCSWSDQSYSPPGEFKYKIRQIWGEIRLFAILRIRSVGQISRRIIQRAQFNLEVDSRPATKNLKKRQNIFLAEKIEISSSSLQLSFLVLPCEELEVGFLEDVPTRVSPAKHFVIAATTRVARKVGTGWV